MNVKYKILIHVLYIYAYICNKLAQVISGTVVEVTQVVPRL